MNRPIVTVLVLLLVAATAGGFYYLRFASEQQVVAPLELPPEQPPLPEQDETPVILHPVPDDPNAPLESEAPAAQQAMPEPAELQPEPVKPLPALDESDPVVLEKLTGLFDRQTLETLFNLDGIIRRFVVTMDNLPRGKLPRQHAINRATAGHFLTLGEDDNRVLDPANYSRYTPFVRVVEALNSDAMVSLYVRHYPLFQQAYEDLGYPSAYFNDRLVEVIDHLLEAPDVSGPIQLRQPRVFYTFADPDLEALSAGQKILIRAGPANAARLKVKLRELRQVLATGAS